MMYVNRQTIQLALGITLLLTGCEDPGVSVGTLGKKLAAPVLQGSSPFDQDFDTQGYVRIQGTCDTRVGDISVSFDNVNFHVPSTTPDTTGTSLSGITNDVNCSDGKFDVYLTKNDLSNTWAISSDGSEVYNIYVKGETLIGETRTLNIAKSGSGGSTGPASSVVIDKVWPANYMGIDRCEMFKIYLTDSNGNETSTSSVTYYSLFSDSGSAGVTYTSISGYTSGTDCSNSSNGTSSFSIPSNTSNAFVYIRVPASYTDGTSYKFKVSSGSYTANTVSVIARDSSSARRWISWPDSTERIYKDTCYPLGVERMTYSQSSASDYTAVTLTLASSNSDLKFYSGSDCSTVATSVTIDSYAYKNSIYMKYTPKAGSTVSYDSATISYTASDSNYDITPLKIRIDATSANTVTKIDFWGPETSQRNVCNPYTIVTGNSNWTPIAASAAMTLSLSSTLSGQTFYSDENCNTALTSSGGVTSVSIAAGSVYTKIYSNSTSLGSGTMTLTGSGLNSVSRSLAINAVLSYTNLLLDGGVSTLTKDTCTLVYLKYFDDANSLFPLTSTYSYNWVDSYSSPYAHLYTDASCTASVAQGASFYPINNGSYYTFYVKVDAAYPSSFLYLTINGGPLQSYSTGWNLQ